MRMHSGSALPPVFSRCAPTAGSGGWATGRSAIQVWRWCRPAPPSPPGYQVVRLSAELVDLAPVLPSVADVFAANGGLSALPIALSVSGMRYTPALLPFPSTVPKVDWGIADFEYAAALLDAE